jgi:serine/threonine-protein kinase
MSAVENLPDRYVLDGLIGAGGMGKVYRAFDKRLERPVAIKVLVLAGDDGAAAMAAALREARAAASIHHPNVATLFDAVEVGEGAFLVMELVLGTPLRRLVGDASVDLAARVRWLADVAGGLAAAHEVGVIHRDIKPENVIVREDGVAKILDFGIARAPVRPAPLRLPALADEHATLSGTLMGTPGYMAPEQIRGEAVDGRADQFGWGVVAYELLTGALPWKRIGTPAGVFMAALHEEPAPFAPELGVPGEVAAVVVRALSKRPEARFDGMAEIAAALAPFAAPGSGGTAPRHARLQASTPPPPPVPSGERTAPPAPGAFRDPDFAAPVDLQAHLDLLPPGATGKGMFFNGILELGAAVRPAPDFFLLAGVRKRRYFAFGDYPMTDYMRLEVAIAKATHPGLAVGEGLRRLGRQAPGRFMVSHVGRTLFGILGLDAEALLLSAGKAYRITLSFGELTVEKAAPGRFLLRARGLPIFLETYHVGVFEGLLAYCRVRGRVRIATEGLAEATFEITLS